MGKHERSNNAKGWGNNSKKQKNNSGNKNNNNNKDNNRKNNQQRSHHPKSNNSSPPKTNNQGRQPGGGSSGGSGSQKNNANSALEQYLDEILIGKNRILSKDEEDANNVDDPLARLKTTCIELASQLLQCEQELFELKQTLPDPTSPMRLSGTTPKTIAFPSDALKRSAPSNITSFGKNFQTPLTLATSDSGRSAPRSLAFPFASGNFTTNMSTRSLDSFFVQMSEFVRSRDGVGVQNLFQLEGPFTGTYPAIQREVRLVYPKDKDWALLQKCQIVASPKGDSATESGWAQFPACLFMYLQYLRDFPDNRHVPLIYMMLKGLTNQCIIALGDTNYGIIILPTVLYLTRGLAKVAMLLDRNPELAVDLTLGRDAGQVESTFEKVTFVESAANLLREAFIKCLADKSGSGSLAGPPGRSTPENKRAGIYMTANSCLKLLSQCQKLRNAQQMFVSIDAQSPLLSHYPAAQRVTYLYYLGRYMFANSHFFRAQLALQSAYGECHSQALRQRRLILIYLISSNICLGRFPSSNLLVRSEASDLANRFIPLCKIIARGDVAAFDKYLSSESEQARWFLRKRVLLQLRSKCEILVWRSLARRVFMESGFHGGEDQKVPFLRLYQLQAAVRWLRRQQRRRTLQETSGNAQTVLGSSISFQRWGENAQNKKTEFDYLDEDFDEAEQAAAETGFDMDTCTYGATHVSRVSGQVSNGTVEEEAYPSIAEVESIMESMIQQGLIHGFLTHANPRFAIPGAKTRGPLAVGFPNIWRRISSEADDLVPGWVKENSAYESGVMGALEGRVVNLSGARPAGAGL